MGSINKQISRFETTAVYTHPDAKVDIVLVHGLNGEPEKTWTAKNKVFWPTDLLPTSLRDAKANVLVYGYNADVYSKKNGGNPSDNFIYMHAQTLVTSLTHYRKDELSSRNPIIWVCHSLGGILVKRALLYSNDLKTSQHEDYRGIYVSTYGLIFLGTPHTGSDIGAWAVMLQAMSDAVVPKAFWHSEPVLLKTLKKDNETLQNINNHFLDIYQRFKIMFAHENHATDLKGTKMLVVDSQSASPQLPGVGYFSIEATHSGMCKFESPNAPGYRIVATSIREWVVEAPAVIFTRWRVEEDEKLARAKHEIEERMKPWLKDTQEAGASMSSISSPTFALNTSQGLLPERSPSSAHSPFEIEEIMERSPIQDPNKQISSPTDLKSPSRIGDANKPMLPEPEPQSTSAEPPSQDSTGRDSSKEPLFVKPSVFKPNTFFKGRDKELVELHRKLMDRGRRSKGTSSVLIQSMPGGGKTHLARQYVFEHKYQYPGGIFWIRSKSLQELEYGYWDIAKTLQLREVKGLDEEGCNDTKEMVKAVHGWLSRNEGWLLVLDGVQFDLPGLEEFIPFAKNTSIIFTSTQRTVGEEYQFDNPQVISLDPLTLREAQELLLEEMGKKKPWNQDDLSRAMELVQLMDRLPLMIHVAALQLKATREPLSKYLRSYKSRPKAGNLPAYRAVREQLQHRGNVAALNLMSLLAFFSQHVPVEMLALGVKALTRETPVKTWDPETRKGSLNGTFKVLIAFALLERNESDEASSSSGRSSRVDMAQDTLDILRIHGIVQQFFVDNLADERLAHFWLERAICVFCRAFDESDNRIQQDSGTGMPEDYLRFHIHGQRLSIFLDRFEKKYPQLYGSREMLDARIDSIQLRIDQLNKRKKNMDNTSGEVQTVSVFERTGSLSEMDSSTPPSNSSLIDLPMYDEDNAPLESPRTYSPTDHNPHHWHVSFPYGMLPPDGVDISRTVTPQPPPTEIFDSISVPEDYEPHVQGTALDDHRTLRRHSERRYRDTAGAWRASPQILSDPRVSLSRETVRGVIPPVWQPEAGGLLNSSQTNRVVIRPGAELTLNNISRVSTLSVIGETPPKSEDHELPGDGRSPARPKFVPGQPSYSNAQTVTALDDDNPVPTFSNVMGTSPGASSSYTAATILRLGQSEKPNSTDGLAPIKVSSPLAAEPLTVSSLRPGQGPASAIESAMDLPDPTKLTQADSRRSSGQSGRGLRSSPTQYFGPFRPPPIPFEVNTTSSLRIAPGNAGGGARQTVSYGRVDQTSIFEDGAKYNLSTHSLPTVQPYAPGRPPSPPYPQPKAAAGPELAIHPPPWNSTDTRLEYAPQGYWSQPLSRDPSHQSSNSHGSARSHSARNRSPLVRSSSIQESSASSSPGPQTMQCPKSRRPSVVETEPSPRLGPAGFEVEPTSYQLYHDSTRGRRRAASGSIYPGQVFLHETTSRSGFPGRLNRHRDSADLSIPHRRAESAGGRLVRGGLESRGSPRRSPDLRGAGGVFTASTSMSGAAGGEGENMARSMSGSGGFKLADGSVVEFGMSPPMAGGRMGGSGDLGLGILD